VKRTSQNELQSEGARVENTVPIAVSTVGGNFDHPTLPFDDTLSLTTKPFTLPTWDLGIWE